MLELLDVRAGYGDAVVLDGISLVVEANHKPIRSRDDLYRSLSEGKAGSVLLLRVVAPGNEGRFLHALEIP